MVEILSQASRTLPHFDGSLDERARGAGDPVAGGLEDDPWAVLLRVSLRLWRIAIAPWEPGGIRLPLWGVIQGILGHSRQTVSDDSPRENAVNPLMLG